MRLSLAAAALGLAAALTAGPQSHAQDWPQQPVRIIVGLAAGGLTDSIARAIAPALSEELGQPVVVENRPGASGTIAAEAVARGPADGYTLLMGNQPLMAITPAVMATRYDPIEDFAPISVIGSNAFVLTVGANIPVKSLPDFMDHVRARPGKLTYAVGGIGNVTHMSMAYFLGLADLDMTMVPYKGGAPAMADLIGGHVDAMFASSSDALPQVESGKLKALAVSSVERLPQLPDVPTMAESGYPQFKMVTWNGLMAPKKVPPEVVERVAKAVTASLEDPAVKKLLESRGITPVGNSPTEFAALLKDEITLWKDIVKRVGVAHKK